MKSSDVRTSMYFWLLNSRFLYGISRDVFILLQKEVSPFWVFFIWSGYFVPRAKRALQPYPRLVWGVLPTLWCHRKGSVCTVRSENCWNGWIHSKSQSVFLSGSIPKTKAKESADSRPYCTPDMSNGYTDQNSSKWYPKVVSKRSGDTWRMRQAWIITAYNIA